MIAASVVWCEVVWGSTGSPSYVTNLRYDPSSRTVYFAHLTEADWPPEVSAFRIGRSNEAVFSRVTNPLHHESDKSWEAWSTRLGGLQPLRASMGFPAHLRVISVQSDSVGTEWWGPFERRLTHVEVRSGSLVGRARITSYLDHAIRVCYLYEVPGGRRLAIIRARGIPFEQTYDVDTPVLLTPEPN